MRGLKDVSLSKKENKYIFRYKIVMKIKQFLSLFILKWWNEV